MVRIPWLVGREHGGLRSSLCPQRQALRWSDGLGNLKMVRTFYRCVFGYFVLRRSNRVKESTNIFAMGDQAVMYWLKQTNSDTHSEEA